MKNLPLFEEFVNSINESKKEIEFKVNVGELKTSVLNKQENSLISEIKKGIEKLGYQYKIHTISKSYYNNKYYDSVIISLNIIVFSLDDDSKRSAQELNIHSNGKVDFGYGFIDNLPKTYLPNVDQSKLDSVIVNAVKKVFR